MLHARFPKLVLAGLCVALISVVFSPNASAQRFDHGTKITINQPFEIPGMGLPAGTYVFRLWNVDGNQNVVEILNADETKLYTIVLAMADFKFSKAPEKTEISFYESQPGSPVPLHEWFFPGDNEYGVSGLEFVYPEK